MQITTMVPERFTFSWTERDGQECEVRFASLDVWTRFVWAHMARDYEWGSA